MDKDMTKSRLLDKLILYEDRYRATRYAQDIDEAYRCYSANNLSKCRQILGAVPTEEKLLEQLVEQLKGKSVYRTLKKLEESENSFTTLKALSSLITHAAISCEQGDAEYKILIPRLIERISRLMIRL